MGGTVELPVWLVVVAAALALIGLADRLLVPGLRWVLRQRVNRVIAEVNDRLRLQLAPFKLTKRQVLIDRLIYDPQVVAAAEAEAAATGKPREVVFAQIEAYAREIVPAFNAYLYFKIGFWLARRVAETLYRVRLGFINQTALAAIPPDSTVVFVINHRSNMDYVLVGYLAADQVTLSYAVGEWARVWPLQALVRAMGAYFIRRNSNDPLYRRVLERYVHMATEAGVPQAVFPEGGLTLDGRLRPPKLGLLDYMVKSFAPDGPRDIVFIPVALNYDRVLEDRSLTRRLDGAAPHRSAGYAVRKSLGFLARAAALGSMGRWYRFGYACVNFGAPVSLRAWIARQGGTDFRDLDREARFARVGRLARDLMDDIAALVPALPVALVATVLLRQTRPVDELEIKSEVQRLMARLEARGAKVYIPRGNRDYAVTVGLRMLQLRHLVIDCDGDYAVADSERALLAYYANSIAHLTKEESPP